MLRRSSSKRGHLGIEHSSLAVQLRLPHWVLATSSSKSTAGTGGKPGATGSSATDAFWLHPITHLTHQVLHIARARDIFLSLEEFWYKAQ